MGGMKAEWEVKRLQVRPERLTAAERSPPLTVEACSL